MIKNGDKIAVGLSGGKDSLLTLLTLSELRRFYPEKFELIAITLDMGMDGFDITPLKKICDEGAEKAYYISRKTMTKVKKKVGFII